MTKLRNIIKNLFLSLIMVWTVNGFAQIDKLNRAQELLQVAKNPDLARPAIDSVVLHPETKKDFVSWTTRAFIYQEIYKRTDRMKLYSPLRDTMISSLKMSNSLKPDPEYKAQNNRLLRALSVTYFNIGKTLLQDSVNEKRSQIAYNKSKDLALLVKPDTNFAKRDVEYYNAVGSAFAITYNADNSNLKALDIGKVALLKVLSIQPENPGANFNLGILYYNQAVGLSKSLDYGADISQIDVIQESMIKLAKQAEQLVSKAHKADVKNPKAVEALYFIYRMLSDNAKTELFKNKCKELGVKLD